MKFDMKDLGVLKFFLSVEVLRTPDGIWLMQRQYALNMLERFGMKECKPMDTPLEQNLKIMADFGGKIEDITMYKHKVGSLIYLTITRLDLAYAMGLIKHTIRNFWTFKNPKMKVDFRKSPKF